MTATTQDWLALAEDIIIKVMKETDNEKAEKLLVGAYRMLGKVRREIRRTQEAEE